MSSNATSFSQKVSLVDFRVSNTENRVGNSKSTGPKYLEIVETVENILEQTQILCNELRGGRGVVAGWLPRGFGGFARFRESSLPGAAREMNVSSTQRRSHAVGRSWTQLDAVVT
jgi:hypothetical protein